MLFCFLNENSSRDFPGQTEPSSPGSAPSPFLLAQLQFAGSWAKAGSLPPSSRPHGLLSKKQLANICSAPLGAGRPTFWPVASLARRGPAGRRGRWKCQRVCVDAAFGCHPSAYFPVRLRTWYLESEPRPPGACGASKASAASRDIPVRLPSAGGSGRGEDRGPRGLHRREHRA